MAWMNRILVAPQPVLRPLLVVGVLAGGLALWAGRSEVRPAAETSYRLTLAAPSDPRCYYGSAWNDGQVFLAQDPRGERVVFQRQFPFIDGCVWRATETLTPMAGGRMAYEYEEHVLACAPGATPAQICPRSGVVRVEPIAGRVAATPLFAASSELPAELSGCPAHTFNPAELAAEDADEIDDELAPEIDDQIDDEDLDEEDYDAEAYIAMAQDAYVRGDYPLAVHFAGQGLDEMPARAWRLIGASRCQQKDRAGALQAWRHADAPTRHFLSFVCGRNGIELR